MTKRREFLKQSALGTAGIAIGGLGLNANIYSAIVGANERINIALIGIRNQGSVHINALCGLHKSHNVNLKTLCDVDELLFDSRSKMVADKTGIKPLREWDLYKVLADKEIDAVSIVLPNHWHALATVLACQAGKHVYIEKPASHNIWEGRKMVEAARKYNVLVQVGHNNRSVPSVREAMKFLHDGGIGDVYLARGLCFKGRDSYGYAKDSDPPSTFNYDRWLGPAPYRPYNVKRSHYVWHWYWDTGNGDTGNQGPHQFDIARWGLNKNVHPVSVYSTGGIYGLRKDDTPEPVKGTMVYGDVETYGNSKTFQETPNLQTCTFRYEDGKILEFETRSRFTNQEGMNSLEIGNIFYGSEGYLEINGNSFNGCVWNAFRGKERKPFAGSDENKVKESGNHWANFFEAIRAGKREMLNCDINEGFYSATLPHLANISYRLGRQLRFIGEYERFASDPEADMMLTREYRPPYIVPEKV
jgi:predicted dehydrogenase